MRLPRSLLCLSVVLVTASAPRSVGAVEGDLVLSHQKISDTQGGFLAPLDNTDFFGDGVASLGDLDGDGIGDIAVGASQTNRGSFLSDTPASNRFGDACECAESTDDGAVMDPEDLEAIRDHLTGEATSLEIEERCSVVGTTTCDIRDLVMLQLAFDEAVSGIETRCDAALSPASGAP